MPNLPTDEELNRLCIEKVLQWELREFGDLYEELQTAWFKGKDLMFYDAEVFSPLTDPAHNEMVLDRMVDLGWWVTIESSSNPIEWSCELFRDSPEPIPRGDADDPDRKRTVVIACLKAVGAIS